MQNDILRMFLFLPQEHGDKKITNSYIAVKQAHINSVIAEKVERISGYGIIFTTKMRDVDVRENLKMKDHPYLLIELTNNMTEDSIVGFLPETDIEELKSLNLGNLKSNAKWLKSELEKAVESDDFEKAIRIRDILKNNMPVN